MLLKTHNIRRGISSLEFLVSFSVMVVVMTFMTSLTFKVSRVWRDIDHDRLAMNELSNQLDFLTRQHGAQLIEQVKNLKPSEFCLAGLPNPRITASLTGDPLGQRIDLELIWDHTPIERKLQLSGWSVETEAADAVNEQSNEEQPEPQQNISTEGQP